MRMIIMGRNSAGHSPSEATAGGPISLLPRSPPHQPRHTLADVIKNYHLIDYNPAVPIDRGVHAAGFGVGNRQRVGKQPRTIRLPAAESRARPVLRGPWRSNALGLPDEIYFSVIQRKLLTPDDFEGLDELADQILAFEKHYNATAEPFGWRFTRTDPNQLLARTRHHDRHAPHPLAA